MQPKLRIEGNVIFDGQCQIAHITQYHLFIDLALNYEQFKALNLFVDKIKDKLC